MAPIRNQQLVRISVLSLRVDEVNVLLCASEAATLPLVLHHPPLPCCLPARRCFVSSSSAPAGLPGSCLTFSCRGTGFSGSTPARCLPWAPPPSNHIILWTVPMASCCFLGTCHGREWISGVMGENQALKTQEDPYLIFFCEWKDRAACGSLRHRYSVMSSSHTPLAHCLLTSAITRHQFSL